MDPISKSREISKNSLANLRMWKPGQSGNTAGRPKKKPITQILEELLEANESREAIKDNALKTLTSRGMAGVLLLREAADRIEGRVADNVNINAEVSFTLSDTIANRRKKLNGDNNES